MAAVAFATIGVGAVVWAYLYPPTIPLIERPSKLFVAKEKLKLPAPNRMQELARIKLQSPLEPFVAAKPVQAVVKPAVRWPTITLNCIFMGPESKLAVIEGGNQTHRCIEGDQVLGILIDEIDADSVKVSFQGESRTIKPLQDEDSP